MRVLGVSRMLKFGLAILFAVGLVWIGSFFRPDLFAGYVVYGVAVVAALLCVGLTDKVSRANWIAAAVLLAVGALFWWLGQGWAAYALALGLGLVGGTLAAGMLSGGHRSPASA